MLASVFLSGRLGEKVAPNVRIVEVDGLRPGPTGVFVTHKIPVIAHRSLSATFLCAKEGAFVIVKGRLEVVEEFGLVVAAELEETFLLPKGAKRITESGE